MPDPLITALARLCVEDYLTEQANQDAASDTERTEPVPLPALDAAA